MVFRFGPIFPCIHHPEGPVNPMEDPISSPRDQPLWTHSSVMRPYSYWSIRYSNIPMDRLPAVLGPYGPLWTCSAV